MQGWLVQWQTLSSHTDSIMYFHYTKIHQSITNLTQCSASLLCFAVIPMNNTWNVVQRNLWYIWLVLASKQGKCICQTSFLRVSCRKWHQTCLFWKEYSVIKLYFYHIYDFHYIWRYKNSKLDNCLPKCPPA